MAEPQTSKSILAVIVLYKMRADESQAYCALAELLRGTQGRGFDVMVCDNTPYSQLPPEGFQGRYVADTSNPGLATCYNLALQEAAEQRTPWLMLLDQDTTPTAEYLEEVIAEAVGRTDRSPEVVALVPKLTHRGGIVSPHFPPRFGPATSVRAETHGVLSGKMYVFNSGAVIRVAALGAIGGFPPEYPLDHLDHATFSKLQLRGGKLLLLRASLIHDLSSNDHGVHDPKLVWRQNSIIDAEHRYFKEYGTLLERVLLRLRLLRACCGRVWRGKNWEQTWRLLKAAFRP